MDRRDKEALFITGLSSLASRPLTRVPRELLANLDCESLDDLENIIILRNHFFI